MEKFDPVLFLMFWKNVVMTMTILWRVCGASFAFCGFLLLGSTPAHCSAEKLSTAMKQWRDDYKVIDDMFAWKQPWAPVRIGSALRYDAASAGRLAARIDPQTAPARDFRMRLVDFGRHASNALADTSSPGRLEADMRLIGTDCRSCHQLYRH
jgi:hypothetical protein